jgi:hypothetical protein
MHAWSDMAGGYKMRPISFALLVLLTLFSTAPADAASDGDVLKQFGMFGRLAVNCAAPASSSNPYLFYLVSPLGKVTYTLKMMEPRLDGTFPMRNLRRLAPDRLQYQQTGRQSELTITVAKTAGKFHSWSSVRADGTVLIADGKFPKTGSPTIVFERCP